MGEKIKTLSIKKISGYTYEVELNYSPTNNLDKQVHIQSEKFRIELNEKTYLAYAFSLLKAERNLINIKKIGYD